MSAIAATSAITCNASNLAVASSTSISTDDLLTPPTSSASIDDILVMIQILNTKAGQQTTNAESSQASALTQQRQDMAKQIANQVQQMLDREHAPGFFGCFGKLFGDIATDLGTGHLSQLFKDSGNDFKAMANSPNFWSDLMKGTSYIVEAASAVASVMTCGAGSPLLIAAVALSAAAMIVENTNCLGKYSQEIGLGLEVLSAVCSFGASMGSTSANVATDIVKAAQYTNDIKGSAQLLQAFATGGSLVCNWQTSNMKIDEQQSQQSSDQISSNLADAIDDIKQSTKDNQALQSEGTSALTTYNNTNYILNA